MQMDLASGLSVFAGLLWTFLLLFSTQSISAELSQQKFSVLDRRKALDAASAFTSAQFSNLLKPQRLNNNNDTDTNSVLKDEDNQFERRLPQAIIIGVKKGGTRALLEYLRLHPDVRAPGPEVHFFDRHYDRGIEWYRKQLPLAQKHHLIIEKTPSYFITKDAPRRIHKLSPNVKLLVVVRNPVTRAISDYAQTVSKRPEMRSFQDMAFRDFGKGEVNTSWGAIKIGLYAKHLKRWTKFFSLNQIHFVSGEALISDPAQEMQKVERFLGLKSVISPKHFRFDPEKGFPCLRRSANPRAKPHCLGKTKGRAHPQVPEEITLKLSDWYEPFNQLFYRMVNRNFGW